MDFLTLRFPMEWLSTETSSHPAICPLKILKTTDELQLLERAIANSNLEMQIIEEILDVFNVSEGEQLEIYSFQFAMSV